MFMVGACAAFAWHGPGHLSTLRPDWSRASYSIPASTSLTFSLSSPFLFLAAANVGAALSSVFGVRQSIPLHGGNAYSSSVCTLRILRASTHCCAAFAAPVKKAPVSKACSLLFLPPIETDLVSSLQRCFTAMTLRVHLPRQL